MSESTELHRERAVLETLYQSLPVGLCLLDRRHDILRINRHMAEINRRPAWEQIGVHGPGLVEDELAGRLEALIERVFETGEPVLEERLEGSVAAAPDERRIWEVSFVPIRLDGAGDRDPSAPVEAVQAIVRDVTGAEAMRRDLEASNAHKDRFVAVLGHELRNPLGVIRHAVEAQRALLAAAEPDPERLGAATDRIGRQVEHMQRLVDDLLDTARLGRGQVRLERQRLDLVALASAEFEEFLLAEDVALRDTRFGRPNQPLPVEGDPVRLTQVFYNLLDNARKFTCPGDQVILEVEPVGPWAVVRVRDTGQGMEPETCETVFGAFERCQEGTGLGLGLAVVRGIVDLHGGTVEAASDGPGHGTEITLRLPLAPQELQES